MPQPSLSGDVFGLAERFTSGATQNTSPNGFVSSVIPSTSGLSTRQGRLPNYRNAVTGRKLMHWLVPEGPIVQMYVNPQKVRYGYSKNISKQRTKGGFLLQYWGEELISLDISGTTGTSGIEGINVLNDIYRNEQLAYDPYALFLGAKYQQDTFAGDVFGVGSAFSSGEGFLNALSGAAESNLPIAATQGPTLASFAFQVELYWSGEVYRGFFESFDFTESSDNIGMFEYNIKFMATQKRGFRTNFFPWHRSATSGPSSSNPEWGTPHSFGPLIEGTISEPKAYPVEQGSIVDELESTGRKLADQFGI